MPMMRKRGQRMKAKPNGIPNPFNPQDPDWQRPSSSGSKPKPKPKISRAGQIRAGSVGVSSSSRQRTNKRGPANRKKR